MTIEEKWSKLSPRERDAWVSESVMGRKAPTVALPSGLNWADETTPRYSTDIAAAWEVVEKIGGKDYRIDFCQRENNCTFGIAVPADAPFVYAQGDTIPHAICLAAMKAILGN